MRAILTTELIFTGPSPDLARACDGGPALDLDVDALAGSFGLRACRVRHSLAGHPLLHREEIAALGDRLPPTAVERHAARKPLVCPAADPVYGGRPSDTVHDLEHSAWSLVLRGLERAGGVREPVDAALDDLQDVLGSLDGQASLILSPPLAVTPARIEADHRLLLQVGGDRRITVGRFGSRAAERRARDRFRRDAQRNLDSIPHHPVAIDLHPGEGVYLPPFAPHWIRTGPFASTCLVLAFGRRLRFARAAGR